MVSVVVAMPLTQDASLSCTEFVFLLNGRNTETNEVQTFRSSKLG